MPETVWSLDYPFLLNDLQKILPVLASAPVYITGCCKRLYLGNSPATVCSTCKRVDLPQVRVTDSLSPEEILDQLHSALKTG